MTQAILGWMIIIAFVVWPAAATGRADRRLRRLGRAASAEMLRTARVDGPAVRAFERERRRQGLQ
jgi:uncharacterized membrane protein YccC